MSRVPLTLLAVPCLRFARWEQAPDALDVRCVRWPQRVPTGHQNQALAVEKGDLERSCCIKHLPEEEVSTGAGLIIPFWSVSWERAVGWPPATCSAWRQRQGCSRWGAEQGLRQLKPPAPLLTGGRERRPVRLGGVLRAFLPALRALNGALETDRPWCSMLLNHKPVSLAAGWSSRQRSFPALHLRELTEERREEEKNQTFSVPSFPGDAGLPLQNFNITLKVVASGTAAWQEICWWIFSRVSVRCTSQVTF